MDINTSYNFFQFIFSTYFFNKLILDNMFQELCKMLEMYKYPFKETVTRT